MIFSDRRTFGIDSNFISGGHLKKYLILIIIAVIFLYMAHTGHWQKTEMIRIGQVIMTQIPQNINYLINTSKCRIPDADPFSEDIIQYISQEKYEPCTKLGLLTYIDKSNGMVRLRINSSLLSEYSSMEITCCYSNITRINYVKAVDNEIKLTPCTPIQKEVNLTFPFVKVVCSNILKNVYTNVHATTLPTPRKVPDVSSEKKYSILLVGIDSMSKSNLRRTMPKTYQYLNQNYISLKGYNKIGDNTFPNLMALLTGYSVAQLQTFCSTKVKMNHCRFVWDAFRASGYTTAYAEDECAISTFNYDRPGFQDPPTDFYYHPYFLASETLPTKKRYDMTFCSGPETSAERMLNIAKDFVVSFKQVPNFGLFWMNSFSHDNVNLPSAMDEAVLGFLSDGDLVSSLHNTIVLVFSDHGFRFGDIRYTHSGWLEERLPFIYIYIPDDFRKRFPEKYSNFLVNTERLTTPYDVFNTFQDILEIGNSSYVAARSHGCPNCRSLFQELPENRTCHDVSIDQHWCTCNGHHYVNSNGTLVRLIGEFIVDEVNKLKNTFEEKWFCANFAVKKIKSAGMSDSYVNDRNETVRYFLVIVATDPKAIFEATVEVHSRNGVDEFRLLGDISRLDRYAEVTRCIKNGTLRKYCFCDGCIKSAIRYLIG
ncbi:uncharacterized protein isoform X1 [Leptinotarsa decemlineata]|uniref:uncharacterized protein isoform X1 n=1 Tax=Leptinotarsa decemlineata TaxID=7539 RepID=UPI003D3064F9